MVDICENPDTLKIINIIRIVILAIRVIVPIILIVVQVKNYMKASSGDDYDLQKANKSFVNSAIAAVAIFLVPTFLNITVKLASPDNLYHCFENANTTRINELYEKNMEEILIKTEDSLSRTDYSAAVVYLNNIKDNDLRKSFSERLEILREQIEAIEKQKMEEENKNKYNANIKYSKEEILAMTGPMVKALSNEEFIEFAASCAIIVYEEGGVILPSLTIAQAIKESGYGDHFYDSSFNFYGLEGYPGEKPKVAGGRSRIFTDFIEATEYHEKYFFAYQNVYGNLIELCRQGRALEAAEYLDAYNGNPTYGDSVVILIKQYDLTKYDDLVFNK